MGIIPLLPFDEGGNEDPHRTNVLILSLGHGVCDGIFPFNATIEIIVQAEAKSAINWKIIAPNKPIPPRRYEVIELVFLSQVTNSGCTNVVLNLPVSLRLYFLASQIPMPLLSSLAVVFAMLLYHLSIDQLFHYDIIITFAR